MIETADNDDTPSLVDVAAELAAEQEHLHPGRFIAASLAETREAHFARRQQQQHTHTTPSPDRDYTQSSNAASDTGDECQDCPICATSRHTTRFRDIECSARHTCCQICLSRLHRMTERPVTTTSEAQRIPTCPFCREPVQPPPSEEGPPAIAEPDTGDECQDCPLCQIRRHTTRFRAIGCSASHTCCQTCLSRLQRLGERSVTLTGEVQHAFTCPFCQELVQSPSIEEELTTNVYPQNNRPPTPGQPSTPTHPTTPPTAHQPNSQTIPPTTTPPAPTYQVEAPQPVPAHPPNHNTDDTATQSSETTRTRRENGDFSDLQDSHSLRRNWIKRNVSNRRPDPQLFMWQHLDVEQRELLLSTLTPQEKEALRSKLPENEHSTIP